MAQRPVHMVADRWFAQLNATVNASATAWVLKANGATGLHVLSGLQDAILHCGTEKVRVSDIATNTPSPGLDTLTVERAYGGTTAASHAADAYVGHYYYEEHHNDLASRIAQLEYFLFSRVGAQDGTVQDGGLQVEELDTPGMAVKVTPGSAVVGGQPVALRVAWTSGTLAAPTGGDSRIDCVRINQYGVMSIVTGTPGGSPTAPVVGAGYLKRAEILLTTGMTSIVNADITDEDLHYL